MREPTHEQISRLAYAFSEAAELCEMEPNPEKDWLFAEKLLRETPSIIPISSAMHYYLDWLNGIGNQQRVLKSMGFETHYR
jgi:hypothetical protein